MQHTLKSVIRGAAKAVHEMKLVDFIFAQPAQVALLGIQFQWTADVQVDSRLCIRPCCGLSAVVLPILAGCTCRLHVSWANGICLPCCTVLSLDQS